MQSESMVIQGKFLALWRGYDGVPAHRPDGTSDAFAFEFQGDGAAGGGGTGKYACNSHLRALGDGEFAFFDIESGGRFKTDMVGYHFALRTLRFFYIHDFRDDIV